jgi:hypothetical protein
MSDVHTPYATPRLPRGPVDSGAEAQVRLQAAFDRLCDVYRGRQKNAKPGASAQYISSLLHRGTPCSLARFVELVCALPLPDRAFVLGALIDDAPFPDKPPLIEIAEATEATGQALGCAERILAESSVTPRELQELKRKVHTAERDLEVVEQSIVRGQP